MGKPGDPRNHHAAADSRGTRPCPGGSAAKRPSTVNRGAVYDIPQKELESYPDVFADIVNALVYGGEQVVDLQRLRQAETETRYRDQERRLRNQYEDLVQHCLNTSEFRTCLLCQCCVVVSQRCHRIASFLRLALTQKSGTLFTGI